MDKRIWITISFVLCILPTCTPQTKPSYTTDLETQLRSELFNSYEVLQRPGQSVNVRVSLTLLTVNELNIKDQTLSVSGYLTLQWSDSRLKWDDPTNTVVDYSNVNFLFSTETYVWRPAIVIENSVDDFSVVSDKNIPMRIKSSGDITWNPSGIYQVACESDITYYPMDTQTCTIKVSSWGYTSTEISLFFETEAVNLDSYGPNGEWDLTSATGAESSSKSRGDQTFSSLTFSISLRRRPAFHILNTIFPVALMALLIPMVFRLPAESGEKLGFCLTVLLAYAVYLTLISDNIPSTSLTVCILTVYLALTLCYGAISVLFVILVLRVHHTPDSEEIPSWIKTLTYKVLLKITCWNGCPCKKKDKTKVTEIRTTANGEIAKPPIVDIDSEPQDAETFELNWVLLAAILDKLFFIAFMLLVTVTSVIIMSMLLIHSSST